jgi:hypothetical protein
LPRKKVVSILADTIIPDAASTQPRKRGWKRWTLALACVVAVVTIVLLATPPNTEPVKVWFVRATNELGEKKLVFEGTNALPRGVVVSACFLTSAIPPGKAQVELRPLYDTAKLFTAAGTNFHFTLYSPPKDVSYAVTWGVDDIGAPMTLSWKPRLACHKFFLARGMTRMAIRFSPTPELHYIPASEIKE